MRIRRLSALLLGGLFLPAVAACQQPVACACPASYLPVIVCGKVMARQWPASVVAVHAADAAVASAPRRSALPRATTWRVLRGPVTVVKTTAGCAGAPVVTVRPVAAARLLTVARARNGQIVALTLYPASDTPVVVRAYRGHRLAGRVTIPGQTWPSPLPPAAQTAPPPPAVAAVIHLTAGFAPSRLTLELEQGFVLLVSPGSG